MRPSLTRFTVLIAVVLCTTAGLAQHPPSPAERLHAAATLATLDTPGLQPWHMKLSINIFGNNAQQGTAEIWSANGDMRTVETFAGKQLTILRINGELLVSGDGDAANFDTNWLIQQILNPVPDVVFLPPAKLKLHKDHFGTTKLDCIEVIWPSSGSFFEPTSRTPAFCLAEDSNRLRVTYGYNPFAYIRPRLGDFQGKEIPMEVGFLFGQQEKLDAKVLQLTTYNPQPGEFAPGEQMHPLVQPVHLQGTGWIFLNQSVPRPTRGMITNQLAGEVDLDIIFGEDGHVVSLHPSNNPDPRLLQTDESSVRQQVVQPYTMNGVPVQIETINTLGINVDPKDLGKKDQSQLKSQGQP